MDWIKVRTAHVDYDFSGVEAEVGWAWIRMMSMTAAMERIPSEEHIKERIGAETYVKLCQVLKKNGVTPYKVLTKVLEDIRSYQRTKKQGRERMRIFRKKLEGNSDVSRNASRVRNVTVTCGGDKIRLDKIREDKKDILSLSSNKTPVIATPSKDLNKIKYGEDGLVLLTAEEHKRLTAKLGEAVVRSLIDALNNGIACRGYKYKSHYHALLNWHRMEEKRRGNRGGTHREGSGEDTAGGKFSGHETEV